ncbi:RIMS-binding protein 2 isoform X1, partial [Lates japonicus]
MHNHLTPSKTSATCSAQLLPSPTDSRYWLQRRRSRAFGAPNQNTKSPDSGLDCSEEEGSQPRSGARSPDHLREEAVHIGHFSDDSIPSH